MKLKSPKRAGLVLLLSVFLFTSGVSAQTVPDSLELSLKIVVLPFAPSGISASTVSTSQINLSWTDNSNNENGFYIEEGVGTNAIFARVTSVGAGVTSYSRTGLSPSTTYFYRVQAFNDAGTSGYSNEASAVTASQNVVTPPPTQTSGGGGGGGGGGDLIPAQTTTATFLGRAYPSSEVTVLKDGQIKASTIAGPDSNFSVSISGLSGGNYIFSIYSEDKNGNRSSLTTFPISVTAGAATRISGIFIAPTIGTDKSSVKQGDNIAIFGQSVPNGKITVSVGSDDQIFKQVSADKSGAYLLNLDTSPLEMGSHIAKSKAAIENEISPFSSAIGFVVGNATVLNENKKNESAVEKAAKAIDPSGSGKVNIVSFSIMAFWYAKPNPPKKLDLNNDGKINLIDLSVLAHYWSG
ncbi:MAG: fibronectin type III domain-containing protein [Minisyncoccia bacterium]